MNSVLNTVDLSGAPHQWDALLESFPQTGVGHLSEWGPIIKASYNMDSTYLAAMSGSEVRGLLPLVSIKCRFFSPALVSMPYLNDGGILAKDTEASQILLHRAREIMETQNLSCLELRNIDYMELGSPPRLDKINMVLDLRGGRDSTWQKKLHSNVRNKIRKSKKMGVEVREGIAGLPAFYDMHLLNMRELGSPAHSLRFFEEIIKRLQDRVRLYVASCNGRTVGGKLVCIWRDTMYFLWVSSPMKYRSYAAVSLMDWRAIEDAMDMGMQFCDFGRSTAGSSHYEFKKKWGADVKQLYWYVYPAMESPTNMSDNTAYKTLSSIWRRLPVRVVRFLGPKIRGGLPQ